MTKQIQTIRCENCGGIIVYGSVHACDEIGATFWSKTPKKIKDWFTKGLRRAKS